VAAGRTITAGNGLTDGGDLTSDITINLGSPSSLNISTINESTGDSHTHAIENYELTGTENQVIVSGTPYILGSTASLSLPQDIDTEADVIFGTLFISSSISGSGSVYFPNIGTDTNNSVVILNSDGYLKTDEIDSRV
jgi:hypothetical protein